MRYQAIADHQGQAPARWLCSALQVSARGYYAWRRRPESARRRRDRQLLVAIRASYERSRRVYGSPRVLLDLQDSGEACSRKRIARIMQGNGLVAVQHRRFKATTISGHDFPVQANLLERNFTAGAPNQVWLGDITYIATEEGVADRAGRVLGRQHGDALALDEPRVESGARGPGGEVRREDQLDVLDFNLDSNVRVVHGDRLILASEAAFAQYSLQRTFITWRHPCESLRRTAWLFYARLYYSA